MGEWAVQRLVLELARRRVAIGGARVLVLGLSFKENCPDLRNTRVIDLIRTLHSYGMDTVVVDPWVDKAEAEAAYGISVQDDLPVDTAFAAVIAAVAHHQFTDLDAAGWGSIVGPETLVFDLKGIVPRELTTLRL